MVVKNRNLQSDDSSKIQVICPHCGKSKFINIPSNVINESRNVTTISIPVNYVCEHSFQVFIDKHFMVRGYQRVDFDISNLEIYSDGSGLKDGEELLVTYDFSVIVKKIILLIRENINIQGIFGGLILTDSGNLIFSSLPIEISLNMIKKIELQNMFTKSINQIFLNLSNNQKLISTSIEVGGIKLIILLFFSAEMDYNTANYYFLELKKNILLSKSSDSRQISYWLYSIISKSENNSEELFLDNLGVKIQKSVIVNLEEIEEILKTKDYVGKIILNERYVRLMEGLIWTVNDALLIISNLNL